MTWEEWYAELDRIAGDVYGPKGAIGECGEECWRSHFDDGESPQDAFDEDRLHWDD